MASLRRMGSPEAKNRAALLDVAEQISTRLVNGVA
jgi:hypothetical protein